MSARVSDEGNDCRPDRSLDAPLGIPQYREVVEVAGPELADELSRLGDSASLDDVRHAVASFARAARNGGVAPEHMLILLKRLLRQANMQHAVGHSGRSALERGIVELAITDYFSAARR